MVNKGDKTRWEIMAKLKDPVMDQTTSEQPAVEEDLFSYEPETGLPDDGLSPDEIGAIPPSAARTPHPFTGYQMARSVPVWDQDLTIKDPPKFPATYLVLLRDENVYQDSSGENVSHAVFRKDEDGNDVRAETPEGKLMAPKVEKVIRVTLKTDHNRTTVHPVTKEHQKWVFDRRVKVGDSYRICCVVPSHTARAQLCFYIDHEGSTRHSRLYELADMNQVTVLRRVFDATYYQQNKAERLAQAFDRESGGDQNAMVVAERG